MTCTLLHGTWYMNTICIFHALTLLLLHEQSRGTCMDGVVDVSGGE